MPGGLGGRLLATCAADRPVAPELSFASRRFHSQHPANATPPTLGRKRFGRTKKGSMLEGGKCLRSADWKTFRQTSEIGCTRGLRGSSAALEDFVRLPSSQAPHRVDRGKVLRAGTHLALFPVVDGLRRCADQKAAFGGR